MWLTSLFCKIYVTSKNMTGYHLQISLVIRQKGKSQNGCFKKNKARQIFRKRNISYPLIHTWTFVFRKMFVFQKIWCALFSSNTCFEIRPFALLPTIFIILSEYKRITKLFNKQHFYKQRQAEIGEKLSKC